MTDTNAILNKVCDLFGKATGTTQENSAAILFGSADYNEFDEIINVGALQLVRSQIEFFVSTQEKIKTEQDESLQDMRSKLAKQQLFEAMDQIISFVFRSFSQKKINEKQLEERCEQIKLIFPKNEKLKEKIDRTKNKTLGIYEEK